MTTPPGKAKKVPKVSTTSEFTFTLGSLLYVTGATSLALNFEVNVTELPDLIDALTQIGTQAGVI